MGWETRCRKERASLWEAFLQREESGRNTTDELPTLEALHLAPRLLLADHPSPARDALTELLRRAGCEVECAPDQEAALTLVGERSYAVVIVDLGLRGPRSPGALRQRLRDRCSRTTSFLAVGVGRRRRDLERADEAGFAEYFAKPIDVDSLLELIAGVEERPPASARAVAEVD